MKINNEEHVIECEFSNLDLCSACAYRTECDVLVKPE